MSLTVANFNVSGDTVTFTAAEQTFDLRLHKEDGYFESRITLQPTATMVIPDAYESFYAMTSWRHHEKPETITVTETTYETVETVATRDWIVATRYLPLTISQTQDRETITVTETVHEPAATVTSSSRTTFEDPPEGHETPDVATDSVTIAEPLITVVLVPANPVATASETASNQETGVIAGGTTSETAVAETRWTRPTIRASENAATTTEVESTMVPIEHAESQVTTKKTFWAREFCAQSPRAILHDPVHHVDYHPRCFHDWEPVRRIGQHIVTQLEHCGLLCSADSKCTRFNFGGPTYGDIAGTCYLFEPEPDPSPKEDTCFCRHYDAVKSSQTPTATVTMSVEGTMAPAAPSESPYVERTFWDRTLCEQRMLSIAAYQNQATLRDPGFRVAYRLQCHDGRQRGVRLTGQRRAKNLQDCLGVCSVNNECSHFEHDPATDESFGACSLYKRSSPEDDDASKEDASQDPSAMPEAEFEFVSREAVEDRPKQRKPYFGPAAGATGKAQTTHWDILFSSLVPCAMSLLIYYASRHDAALLNGTAQQNTTVPSSSAGTSKASRDISSIAAAVRSGILQMLGFRNGILNVVLFGLIYCIISLSSKLPAVDGIPDVYLLSGAVLASLTTCWCLAIAGDELSETAISFEVKSSTDSKAVDEWEDVESCESDWEDTESVETAPAAPKNYMVNPKKNSVELPNDVRKDTFSDSDNDFDLDTPRGSDEEVELDDDFELDEYDMDYDSELDEYEEYDWDAELVD